MNNRKHVGLPKPIGRNGSATLRPLMKQGHKEINSCGVDGIVWGCDKSFQQQYIPVIYSDNKLWV